MKNKNLEELAKQAFQHAADQASEEGKGSLGVFAEKFAELIVRECLDEIQYDDGATHVDELLPKHFGFEL